MKARQNGVAWVNIDWGSFADWVGAIGGVAGATTAATFYFLDRKRARVAQDMADKKQERFEADVTTHLYLLFRGILDVSRGYLEHDISFADTIDMRAEIGAYAATAIRMQGVPGLPIERFMDLCDLLEAITDRRIEGKNPEAIKDAVAHIKYVVNPLQEKLAQELRLDS